MGYIKNEKQGISESSLYDRVKKLLVSYEWSDCNFYVSEKNFKAHKLIMGISSPVFEAMFYGPLSSNSDIIITDIQPDTFQLLLNYVYTDQVEISSIEQAFNLLYSSRKYMLEHLTEICIEYIKSNTSVDNVIDILNYPDCLQDNELVKFSLKLLCEHAGYLLEEKKQLITCSCMKAILECDQINISEKDLVKHVFEWSTYCCEQNDIQPTFENRHTILKLKGMFKLLRFNTLTASELDEIYLDDNNLLLLHEYENLKTNIKTSHIKGDTQIIVDGSSNVLQEPRTSLKIQWYMCYRSSLRSMAPIMIDSNNYTINARIKSNKSIFIKSLCVPTRRAPAVYFRNNTAKVYSEQLSVTIVSEVDNSIIMFTNFMNTVEYDSIVDIELKEPCFIKKDNWYKISFIWPSTKSPPYAYVYTVEYRDKQYAGQKVAFEFEDVSFSAGNGGSFLEGLKFCL